MNYIKRYLSYTFMFVVLSTTAQEQLSIDELRGAISPERMWWDLLHYELRVNIQPENKFISGTNNIRFKVLDPSVKTMQIDLQEPMQILEVYYQNEKLTYKRIHDSYFILFPDEIQFEKDEISNIKISFYGHPKEAKTPPWDGGLVWKVDSAGDYFSATAVQGIGASTWWPTKEHSYDKPDEGVDLYYTTSTDYSVIGNGRLIEMKNNQNGTYTWHWKVSQPISNYNISFNLGKYAMIEDTYQGLNGDLDLTYFPLAINKDLAVNHFEQVKKMLEAMEYWFGPYPFYEDSYKLVEAPFVGMEHQSNVAWGNAYQNGYAGRDISGSGYGMNFDFMIVHESIHEWFGNSLTHIDIGDMWLHEGFTSLGEALYVEYFYGTEAGKSYTKGTRKMIQNKNPIQRVHGLHNTPDIDMYYKAANMLLTLREIINNDKLWRKMLLELQKEYFKTTVNSKTVEEKIAEVTNLDLSSFFDVYLRQAKIPKLELQKSKKKIQYKFSQVSEDFNMPLRIYINEQEEWINPTTNWQTKKINKGDELIIDENFYIEKEIIQK